MSSERIQSNKWLISLLESLSADLDSEVIGEYIISMLDMSSASDSIVVELNEFLSAYIPSDLAASVSAEILDKYKTMVGLHSVNEETLNKPQLSNLTGDEQMRMFIHADSERIIKRPEYSKSDRDPCTLAVLREVGAFGYQDNSENGRDLETASADTEFLIRQRLDSVNSRFRSDLEHGSTSEATSELEGLDDISGYGKKNTIKPGSIEDALEVLKTCTSSEQRLSVSSGCLSVQPEHSTHPNYSSNSSIIKNEKSPNYIRTKRKKFPRPSKHIMKVGSKAEAKQDQNIDLQLKPDMDAFLLDT